MVGSFCSPIGLGSDIGGSLRSPASFNGVMTIKASNNRISKMGNCNYGKFQGGFRIKSDLGPITRSVEDLIIYLDYFCKKKNYDNIPLHLKDPYVSLVPFQYEIFYKKPKLKIGLVKHL